MWLQGNAQEGREGLHLYVVSSSSERKLILASGSSFSFCILATVLLLVISFVLQRIFCLLARLSMPVNRPTYCLALLLLFFLNFVFLPPTTIPYPLNRPLLSHSTTKKITHSATLSSGPWACLRLVLPLLLLLLACLSCLSSYCDEIFF